MKRALCCLATLLIGATAFCQNAVLTRDCSMANIKNQITAVKILIEVLGDSTTNELLLNKRKLPGPIKIEFDGLLKIRDISYLDKNSIWTGEVKNQFSRSIRKHIFFLSDPDFVYLKDEDIEQGNEEGCAIFPFASGGQYQILFRKRRYFMNCQNPKEYQFVDYAKELIAQYDKIKIKGLDGRQY